MKLTPPKTFQVPEGTQPGDYFKTLDEWKLLPNGDVELCELDGNSMPESSDQNEPDESMSVPDRAAARMAAMQTQNSNPSAPVAAGY